LEPARVLQRRYLLFVACYEFVIRERAELGQEEPDFIARAK